MSVYAVRVFAEYDRSPDDGPTVYRGRGIVRAVSRRHALDKAQAVAFAAHPEACSVGAEIVDDPERAQIPDPVGFRECLRAGRLMPDSLSPCLGMHAREVVTCGACQLSWCDRCDPAPSTCCHVCNGRGYSTAPIK